MAEIAQLGLNCGGSSKTVGAGLRTVPQNQVARLGLPLGLFLISGLMSALIAFDPAAAWFRFGLILSGVVLFIIVAYVPERIHLASEQNLPILRLGFALFPAVLALAFILSGDWTNRIGVEQWLVPVLWLAAGLLPRLPGDQLDPNVVGGVLAAFIPLQAAALKWHREDKSIWPSLLLIGMSLCGLFLSELRGAWLALAAVGFLWLLWKLCGALSKRWGGLERSKFQAAVWIALVGLLVSFAVVAVVGTPVGGVLLGLRSDRWAVWRNSLDLVSDYPFTGLGLGGFEMAYSSYALLLHVGYTEHAHNLYLDLWLQQGLLGVLSFAWMALGAVKGRGSTPRWRVAAFASLGVILLHGMVDDVFIGYGAKALPLLFIPLGLLMRNYPIQKARPTVPHRGYRVSGLVACLVAMSFFLPGIRAAFPANLGALSQTRAELSVYRRPDWPVQDQVRRAASANLAPAIVFYQTALALDPMNATANRRLGQIELSLGQYDSAQRHLTAAYTAAPDQRATRQMLGEAYAIAGDTERAAALWGSIDVSEGQLGIRQWWYEHIGEVERAALVQRAATCCGG